MASKRIIELAYAVCDASELVGLARAEVERYTNESPHERLAQRRDERNHQLARLLEAVTDLELTIQRLSANTHD